MPPVRRSFPARDGAIRLRCCHTRTPGESVLRYWNGHVASLCSGEGVSQNLLELYAYLTPRLAAGKTDRSVRPRRFLLERIVTEDGVEPQPRHSSAFTLEDGERIVYLLSPFTADVTRRGGCEEQTKTRFGPESHQRV